MIIKFKITRGELTELLGAYSKYIPLYVPDSAHEELLFEHLIYDYYFFLRLYKTDKKKYTITLTAPAALAFYQAWQGINLCPKTDIFASVIINKVIGIIHVEHVNLTLKIAV